MLRELQYKMLGKKLKFEEKIYFISWFLLKIYAQASSNLHDLILNDMSKVARRTKTNYTKNTIVQKSITLS